MTSGTEIPLFEMDGKERFELLEMKEFDGILQFGFTRIDDDAFLFPTPDRPTLHTRSPDRPIARSPHKIDDHL